MKKIENEYELLKIFKRIFENLNESFKTFKQNLIKIKENCNDS